MTSEPTPWYLSHLACPDCGVRLDVSGGAAIRCECGYICERKTPLDLRPISPLARTLVVAVSSTASRDLGDCLVERPASRYSGPKALRDSSELFSAVLDILSPGQALLDLGCGPRDQAVVAAHLGLDYVGVDFASQQANLLADAHALPFQDATFDAVLSYAVLEHLCNPFLAMREVARVLKPGGVFFGTVSQGEPFHDSFYHHTAWGTLHVLNGSGLRTTRLWHSHDTLHALASMGRYARVVRWLIGMVDIIVRSAPALSPRKHFRWSAREKEIDALHRSASICFVARKADVVRPS